MSTTRKLRLGPLPPKGPHRNRPNDADESTSIPSTKAQPTGCAFVDGMRQERGWIIMLEADCFCCLQSLRYGPLGLAAATLLCGS